MKQWRFRLIDTGFFRDGTPFVLNETGALHQNSSFPPLMNTLQGAIRTSLARFQGWDIEKARAQKAALHEIWDQEILGDVGSLGRLKLWGPYLEWDGERLYPIPSTLLFDKQKESFGWLVPGEMVESDLGKKRLLQSTLPKGRGFEVWVNRRGYRAVLNGQHPEPSDLFWPDQMWRVERRVGIKRDAQTDQAVDGHLYTSSHIRPAAPLRICVNVEGVPEDWVLPTQFSTPLGGEGRFAEVTVSESISSLPSYPDFSSKQGKIQFTVPLLTPFALLDQAQVVQKGPIPHLSCVVASLGSAFSVGGWDLSKGAPRPLEPMLPAGSTWFYEADQEVVSQLRCLHGTCLGEKTAYGFGQICIGKWGGER